MGQQLASFLSVDRQTVEVDQRGPFLNAENTIQITFWSDDCTGQRPTLSIQQQVESWRLQFFRTVITLTCDSVTSPQS